MSKKPTEHFLGSQEDEKKKKKKKYSEKDKNFTVKNEPKLFLFSIK